MYTGIHGVAAICAALLGRVKSGKGQHIDLSLYDCLVSIHDYAVQCYTLSGGKDVPVQTGHDMPQSTLYGVFTASDGYLVIAAQVDDAWKRFAKVAGGDAFAADTRFHTSAGRNAHRLEILAVAKAWVATQTFKQCLAALDAIDVPCAKVQNIDEVLADPQIIARGMVIEQDHPVLGKIRLPNLPFRFSGCDTSPTSVAPDMGQHNREIAASLGFGGDEIEAMVRDGVLYSPVL
jgi:crotonobetainyl-CoA:carnitine CoA-transferase CaiB-like acyl-CoA transferase